MWFFSRTKKAATKCYHKWAVYEHENGFTEKICVTCGKRNQPGDPCEHQWEEFKYETGDRYAICKFCKERREPIPRTDGCTASWDPYGNFKCMHSSDRAARSWGGLCPRHQKAKDEEEAAKADAEKKDIFEIAEEQRNMEKKLFEVEQVALENVRNLTDKLKPVPLSDCTNFPWMFALKMTEKDQKSYAAEMGGEEAKLFYLIGEIAQAPGHVVVMSSSGKIYPMMHSHCFIVATPKDV